MVKAKLQQGQTWKRGQQYLRITRLERLAVEYKVISDLATRHGAHHKATKKEFCCLIKNAELLPAKQVISLETSPVETQRSAALQAAVSPVCNRQDVATSGVI